MGAEKLLLNGPEEGWISSFKVVWKKIELHKKAPISEERWRKLEDKWELACESSVIILLKASEFFGLLHFSAKKIPMAVNIMWVATRIAFIL